MILEVISLYENNEGYYQPIKTRGLFNNNYFDL